MEHITKHTLLLEAHVNTPSGGFDPPARRSAAGHGNRPPHPEPGQTLIATPPTQVTWHYQDARGYRTAPSRPPRFFHERLPEYAPTPLVNAERLAEELGVGQVWVKDESSRLGLPSFKILGASWATYRALEVRGRFTDQAWTTVQELARLVAATTGIEQLAAATDGNHGRAVARVARWLGLKASIFVPADTSRARIEAITSEGAQLEVVAGGYGDAVRRSAREASDTCLVISDTSWPGYVDIPHCVVSGYSTIFEETEQQLARCDARTPDVVVVQVGVGALASAAVRHWRAASAKTAPRLIAVEPLAAACNLRSMQAGRLVTIPGPHDSIMVGLNCDSPSLVAWPDVSGGIDLFLAVGDDAARKAMRSLARVGVVAGETGAAGLAGLEELTRGAARSCRDRLGIDSSASVLLISTEGATDPQAYAHIVHGQPPHEA
jgi:diaminopropionate ammonia-lyase